MIRTFSCGAAEHRQRELDTLQDLVSKHIRDPALANITGDTDFAPTSTERGVQRWEQAHLVAALDVLNAYQRDRRAQAPYQLLGGNLRLERRKNFKRDPRTRVVELLKRWLRTQAASTAVSEDEVRSISGLCRDILNHPRLFPSRNNRSFIQTVAEVYDHVQWQLREVLERDRTCAELAFRALSLSRNLISDAISYLLLGPTDLRQTDALPSLEVVSLWQSLPDEGHPLAGRTNPGLQRTMKEAWRTRCGSLLAEVLRTQWCVRLFEGASAVELASLADVNAASESTEVPPLTGGGECRRSLAEAEAAFARGNFRNSGLAGAFRDPAQHEVRQRYIDTIATLYDVVYLFGEVLMRFHSISDGLGDYGMIRIAPWLHPVLEVLMTKVQSLRSNLEQLNEALDQTYVLARARGMPIEKPAPSNTMGVRAHACIERAVNGRSSHAQVLLQVIDDLKAKSAPDRLPHVAEGITDACMGLHGVLQSPEFRSVFGNSALPELPPQGAPRGAAALEDKRPLDYDTSSALSTRPPSPSSTSAGSERSHGGSSHRASSTPARPGRGSAEVSALPSFRTAISKTSAQTRPYRQHASVRDGFQGGGTSRGVLVVD